MLLTIESQWKNSSFLSPLPQSRWNYQRLPGQHLACHPESNWLFRIYVTPITGEHEIGGDLPFCTLSAPYLACKLLPRLELLFFPFQFSRPSSNAWHGVYLSLCLTSKPPPSPFLSLPFSLPQNILWYFLFNVTCPFSQTIIVVVSHHESLSMYIYWLFNSFVVMEILFPRRGVCG